MDGCLRSGSIPNLTQRCTRSFSKAVGLVGLIGLVGWVGWLVGWVGNFGHLASGFNGGLSKLLKVFVAAWIRGGIGMG